MCWCPAMGPNNDDNERGSNNNGDIIVILSNQIKAIRKSRSNATPKQSVYQTICCLDNNAMVKCRSIELKELHNNNDITQYCTEEVARLAMTTAKALKRSIQFKNSQERTEKAITNNL